MASTFSTNLAIELIGTGDQAGTWGATTNTNLGTLVEQAISGYVTQAVATGTDTTITIPNGATGVARNMFIELTGTGGALTNLIVPANKKLYFIYNNASGAVTVKVSGQTGVSVGVGEKKILVSNGTDIVEATSYLMSGAASATITNLSVTSANITTLTSSSGTVTNLLATTASFGSASISNADILSATITSATITGAGITSAAITTLTGTTVSYGSGSLTGLNVASAQITKFTAGSSAISNLFASGAITTVGNISTSGNLSASGSITASSGSITQLTSTSATITTLKATSATIDNVSITSYTVTAATITSANITTLTGTTLGYASASVTTLTGTTIGAALSSTIRGISGAITTLTGTSADITTITGVTIGNTTSSTIRGVSGAITTLSGTTLNYGSASITTLTGGSMNVTTATHASANITTLGGTTLGYASASITTVTGTTIGAVLSSTISGISGTITNFNTTSAAIAKFTAGSSAVSNFLASGTITAIGNISTSGNLSASGSITASSGSVTQLTSTSATITTLTGTTVGYGSASLTNMKAVSAVITSATVTGLGVTSANITTLTSASGTITNLLGTTLTISGSTFLATSTGNVGIGTSSPVSRLDVTGAFGTSTTAFTITNSSAFSATNIARLDFRVINSFGGTERVAAIWGMNPNATANNGGALVFGVSANGTSTTPSEVALFDQAGNFGLGTTSPAAKLDVNGAGVVRGFFTTTDAIKLGGNTSAPATTDAFIYRPADNTLAFGTASTERGRFASDGQFQVASSLAGNNLLSFNNSSATGYGISVTVNNNSSGTYRYFEGLDSGPTQRIAIYTNGDVKNTNGVFAAFSDVKLKKDIVDAGSQWDDIKALRVRKYKLKDDAEGAVQIGLIAQEVEQVSPGLVNESQDETRDEDGNIVLTGEVTKGVKYSILYMKAVKALQEAMARIEKLEAEVAALKGA